MDRQVVSEKLESLRRCVRRIEQKCPADVRTLIEDIDLQDVLVLNLSRAVQMCVDIAAHLVAEREIPPPETMSQSFDVLHREGVINEALAGRLRKAVGFRNIAVHNYERIDWTIVHAIARNHLDDFEEFARVVSAQIDGSSGDDRR